jgi:hypothetical protein
MTPASAPLARWEKTGLALFGLLVAVFGALVLVRSAFQQDRKTDFGVYARAGYAVRAGEDIYAVCDNRGWHYCYPPPFAVLMAPLGDPWPWTADRAGYLPFWVSVAVWYVVSVLLVGFTVHTLAKAVLPDAVPGSRRWWYARTVPVYVCVGGIGYTLSRGQVNVLLVALVAGMFAAAMRQRPVRAGLWLAAAIALKVIPGLLILFPLVRRQWRAGVGVALGLFALLGVVPVAVWGVEGAIRNDLKIIDAVLAPGATGGGDQTRAVELTNTTATDSQSFQAVIHNIRNPNKATRPPVADRLTRLTHWAVGGLMTLVTVLAAWRRPRTEPAEQLVFLGCLCVVMLLLTPVSHMHYYAMALPLVAGLWLKALAARPERAFVGGRVLGVLSAWGVLTAIPLLPYEPTAWLREMGLATFSTVGLWLYGVAELRRRTPIAEVHFLEPQHHPQLIAA